MPEIKRLRLSKNPEFVFTNSLVVISTAWFSCSPFTFYTFSVSVTNLKLLNSPASSLKKTEEPKTECSSCGDEFKIFRMYSLKEYKLLELSISKSPIVTLTVFQSECKKLLTIPIGALFESWVSLVFVVDSVEFG